MAIYSALKAEVLANVDHTGSLDAGLVVQNWLVSCIRYVSSRMELPALRLSTSYTLVAADVTAGRVSISDAGKLNATSYSTPNRLFVRSKVGDTIPGTPFEYVEFMHYLDLKASPVGSRETSLYADFNDDLRPDFPYTIDGDNLIFEDLVVGNVLTFYYMKEPAAYVDANTPEIPNEFQYILVNGATLALKEWVREPDNIMDPHSLFSGLNEQIVQMDLFLHGRRKRSMIRIHPSYWTK